MILTTELLRRYAIKDLGVLKGGDHVHHSENGKN